MAILVVGDLVFPGAGRQYIQRQSTLHGAGTHPSYSPTASWTKSRVSSGNSNGRSAVVSSRDLKNIWQGSTAARHACRTR